MPAFPNEDIQAVRQRLKDGMTSYMQGDGEKSWNAGYSQSDIDHCMMIVDDYLAAVAPGLDLPQAKIREAVKRAVLDLNALNESCRGPWIETDQREGLCQLILGAAIQAGLDTDEDITEEWRDW